MVSAHNFAHFSFKMQNKLKNGEKKQGGSSDLQWLKKVDAILTDITAGLYHSLKKINDLVFDQWYETRKTQAVAQLHNGKTFSGLECGYSVSIQVL